MRVYALHRLLQTKERRNGKKANFAIERFG